MNWRLLMMLCGVLMSACTRQQHPPRHIVILVDTSASIEPQAETECLDAIGRLTAKLDRGDEVSVIPITGDAEVQSTGHVLRFQKPINRSAYDADLIRFSKQVHDSLQTLRIRAIRNPTARTDIFGAIHMGIEELAYRPNEQDRLMIIFSDFIEDDGTVNFSTDHRFAEVPTAMRYANEEAKRIPMGGSSKASLGLLRSRDLHALSKSRREAIKQFWLQYLRSIGMQPVWATDGVGLLSTRR